MAIDAGSVPTALRLAFHRIDADAARLADEEFCKHPAAIKSAGTGPIRARMDCSSAPIRKLWMDLYVKAGGEVQEVCGERVAPLVADEVISQIVDKVFYSRHPELQFRKLSLNHDDGTLRREWMELYEDYGGRVARVCGGGSCPPTG